MTIGDEMVAKLESDCIITVSKPTVDRFPNISISHETNLIDCHVTSIWNKLWNVICCFVDDDSKRSLGSSSRGKGKLLLMENILRPHLKHNKSLNDSTENEITMRIRDGNRLALNNWKAEVNEDFEVYKDFVVVSPYSEDGKRNNGKDSAYFAKLNDLWKLISRQKMLITDGTYSRVPQLQLEDIVRPGIASGYQFNTSFQQAAIPSGYTSDPYISIQLENILRPGIDSGGIVISLQPWAMIDGFLGPSSDDPPTPQRSIEQQRVINRRIAYKLTKKASKSLNPFLKRNQNELFLYLESFSLSMDISMRKFQKILIGESISTVDQKPMLEAIHKAGLDRFEDPSDFIWNQLRLHEKDMKKMEIKARKLRKIRIFRVSKNVENDRKLEETIERSELPPANESFSFYIKYYTNFFEAHNQNVNAFNNILENPPLFCKESKALSFDQYSTKLKSDIIMKKAVQLRHEIERKIADLRMRIRFELINEKNISPVYLQSPYYVEKFKRINFKRLRSQIRKNDSNDNSDILAERIYEKRRWSVACGRPVEDFEAGVDINVDVNVNVKDRKLTSSPTRRPDKGITTVTTTSTATTIHEVLQWAFCNHNDFMDYKFSMPEEDSCTVSFDFLTMKVQLSVIRAGKLLEDFIPLDNMFALTFDNEMNNNIENNTENYKQNGYTQKLEFGLVCINKINNSLEGINNYFKIHTQNTIQIKKTLASIIPSIITPPRKFSEVYKELLRSDILMKYATRYRHEIQNKVSKLRSRARCAIFGQDDDTPTYFQSLIFLNKYKRINFKRRKRIIPNFEPNEDGIYERRRWIAGYGESDLDSSLTCRQVPGVPIYMPFTEVTPQEALQWVFCIHHDSTYDRYSMPKNDSCSMIFDFVAMEIRISVLRLGYVLKETFLLDKLYMISAVNPEQTLEISLLDDISYEKLTLEKKDKTYLHWAIKTNNIESVFVVIDRVKDINATDKSGYTALHLACMGNHKNIVLKLIELKANLNLYDRQLNTALHLAVAQKNFDIIRILIANDADATLKNKENKIPFESFPDEYSRQSFFIDQEHTLEEFKAHNYHLWFYFIQIQDITGIEDKVLQYVQLYLFLAYAKDGHGRVACDMATPSNKAVINSVFLWHGRFRVTEARPEHTSATCFVFKGYDEDNKDDTGNACPVALKLMRVKKHFLREISARDRGFDNEYVIDILERYPKTNEELDKWPEITAQDTAGLVSLNKIQAESFFCIVMPLANRNMFVALKQERFAGRNMEEVRHIFIQLVNCVQHMHERGVLHADIKTLNIVRVETQWKLIDMDATCIIGQDPVGFKSSSAYIPPETIYIDPIDSTARVRSSAVPVPVSVPVHVVSDASINIAAVPYNNSVYELILAHPSFDVWSLGCILFQMCNIDVRPLFQGGQDDNLSDDITEDDNLHRLAEWTNEIKERKLSRVVDSMARNLLAQMLSKDPSHRPTLSRVLAHPFLSMKKPARLVGEEPKYDVFISYRVFSDSRHAEILYNLLTFRGLKVYWDKVCLVQGQPWEEGFCDGAVSSRVFVPLLSKPGLVICEKLTESSPCDNVLLEHRLALELKAMGLVDAIVPVMIGDFIDSGHVEGSTYSRYSYWNSNFPDVHIEAVEQKLREHLDRQALGAPLQERASVKVLSKAIGAHQGEFVGGEGLSSFTAIANKLVDTIRELKVEKLSKSVTNSPRGSVSGPGTDKMVEALHREISRLEKELKEKSSTIVPLPSLEIDIDKVKELDKDVAIAFLTDRLHACGEEIKELRAVLERFTRQAATDSVCSSSSSLSPRSSRIDIHRAVLSAREASTDVLNMKLELLHKENIALKEEIRIMKERLDNINM